MLEHLLFLFIFMFKNWVQMDFELNKSEKTMKHNSEFINFINETTDGVRFEGKYLFSLSNNI